MVEMVARVDDGSGQVLIQQYQSRRVTKQRHVTDRTHATEGFQQKVFGLHSTLKLCKNIHRRWKF